MTTPANDISDLLERLEAGPPPAHEQPPRRIPKPIYNLSIDDPDERSIILIIRTSKDGVARGMISLPQWYELPEMWEGPFDIETAMRLADDYAHAYGYYVIAIDIESSQLWNPSWGELLIGSD